ncbi:hypothetical protein F4781DRAFT_379853 [Annulohypoxylon bovei var. microspora]|nr:hypothetical protein F4781DRAFT_379853 [Annulohypoxylon bovei var. microspora]
MGMFDNWDGESVISNSTRRSRSHHHKTSKSRESSRSHKSSKSSKRHSGLAGFFGVDNGHSHHSTGGSHYSKNNGSKSSFFNLGNGSTRSFFSLGRSNSYYKRQPRSSFVQRTLKKLKRLLRDLMYYAKRHPIKVFMLVIMPLITGGALTALLARFGLRLPPSIERMLGVAARAGSGSSVGLVGEAVRMAGGLGRSDAMSVGRDHHGEYQFERREYHSEGRSGGGGFFDGIRDFFS